MTKKLISSIFSSKKKKSASNLAALAQSETSTAVAVTTSTLSNSAGGGTNGSAMPSSRALSTPIAIDSGEEDAISNLDKQAMQVPTNHVHNNLMNSDVEIVTVPTALPQAVLFENEASNSHNVTEDLRQETSTLAHSNGNDCKDGTVKTSTSLSSARSLTSRHHGSSLVNVISSSNLVGMDVDTDIDSAYENVPFLDIIELPRGGVSIETSAVGRVQFGIPPETIKDSMNLGLSVPSVYIVPVDRFCRDMGPALGVNLAEFEFPAYFNFFVQRKRCTLIVDSIEAERNIRRVFSETLLGPAMFRTEESVTYAEEDFSPEFPKEAIPNFYRELKHFRIMPNGEELVLETLLKFSHFESAPDPNFRDTLGVPPLSKRLEPLEQKNGDSIGETEAVSKQRNENGGGEKQKVINPRLSGSETTIVKRSLTYSQIRWIGDVVKIYPTDASEDEIARNKTSRVEIFKLPSGTDYVLHDVNKNNVIVGKARFSGHVRVAKGISVIGLNSYDDKGSESEMESIPPLILPPSFHPPSFGVTVLGNSHGFDKNGSTSGYVLWINGRGVMIDPPPYSSATLEREGIRPRTIVGIILTHCHADHDAGAFQKVLMGSPVVVITTPTIYKSFIRKYAALSSLSPALLRHSHRFKPAVIGEPLRFQGATFHFIYTLHSIPCVGFRVDWRGRSMVFTGDHFNNPPAIERLVEQGVLSKARAADLNNLPLQQTDLLLHEAGAPPIHTPLDVLLKLPTEVKNRLYIVHTSALPEGCELRVAPTGTIGTIRLDNLRRTSGVTTQKRPSTYESSRFMIPSLLHLTDDSAQLQAINESAESELFTQTTHNYAHLLGPAASSKQVSPPPVSLRPTSSSDAWFILNLLSAVPFMSSLLYTSAMEVLETARVVAFCCNEIVLHAFKRSHYLVVVWEGTCMERDANAMKMLQDEGLLSSGDEGGGGKRGRIAVWHAGDWTGPRILQPEKRLSGDSSTSATHDIVAMSSEGVKVIMIDFTSLHRILNTGSSLYQKYHLSLSQTRFCSIPPIIEGKMFDVFKNAVKNLNIIELLDSNTVLRKLTAVQKRHLECLVEGPNVYGPGQRLWKAGSMVDKAFIVVAGTVSFVPKRRHGGSASKIVKSKNRVKQTRETNSTHSEEDPHFGEMMHKSAVRAVREIQAKIPLRTDEENSGLDSYSDDASFLSESKSTAVGGESSSLIKSDDFARLSIGLQKWAERHDGHAIGNHKRRGSSSTDVSPEVSLHDFCDVTTLEEVENRTDSLIQQETLTKAFNKQDSTGDAVSDGTIRKNSKERFANKVLGRLYNRRAFASGLVFSRGHFLGDIEKMVEGILSSANANDGDFGGSDFLKQFDFNEVDKAHSLETITINETEGVPYTSHNSTLAAGKDGCLAVVLPKSSLIPFLDAYPGLLLSLLGTQVVV